MSAMLRMKTITPFVLALSVALVWLVGLAPAASAADLNNFTINQYKIDYYLDRDADGRSKLTTVEKIEAEFPSYDQNHGIERAVPKSYDGHSTSLKVESVTDGTGNNINFTTYDTNGNEVIRIGDAAKFVHGLQDYVITYTQRDVTRYFADTQSDEFYWDTNGTEWAVPIKHLSVALHIADSTATKLNGNQKCYFGRTGSNAACPILRTNDGFSVETSNVSPFENATVAVGFQPQTFTAYKMSLLDRLIVYWVALQFLTPVVAVLFIVVFLVRFMRKSNRRSELGTIIAEYTPPADTSITVAGSIYRRQKAVFSAQLIDFAVRHYMKIYQTSEKSLFSQAKYELEITKDISDLRDEEQEIIRDIFPDTAVGTRLKLDDMKKNRLIVYLNLSDNQKKLNASIRGAYGLRAKDVGETMWFRRAAVVTLLLAIVTLSPSLLMVSIGGFVASLLLWPLTDKGLALLRYLEGLKLYIKTAEADRLRMLQSPEGAAKLGSPLDPSDTRTLIQLYERVLPYAILFGQEKDWNKRIGRYYESLNTAPEWYVGNNAVFNAALFSSAISNFNSVATYSNPTSSSSGGSGGGGSSGGGGGGGGGGGW